MTKKNLFMTTFAAGALSLLAGAAMLAASPASAAAPAASAAAPVFDLPPAGVPNLTGKWIMAKPNAALKTLDGKEPPLNAAGKAEYAKRQAALKAGDKKIDPINDCIMQGTPRLLYTAYPFLILQGGKQVAFVHEANHTFRSIYFNEKLPDDPDPNYLGYSVAKWQGNTLVIDTIGLNDKTWLDYSGLPHGTKLQVQERYTPAGNTIKGELTIKDPDFYTAPWKTSFTLNKLPGMAIAENVCMDTHKM